MSQDVSWHWNAGHGIRNRERNIRCGRQPMQSRQRANLSFCQSRRSLAESSDGIHLTCGRSYHRDGGQIACLQGKDVSVIFQRSGGIFRRTLNHRCIRGHILWRDAMLLLSVQVTKTDISYSTRRAAVVTVASVTVPDLQAVAEACSRRYQRKRVQIHRRNRQLLRDGSSQDAGESLGSNFGTSSFAAGFVTKKVCMNGRERRR